MLLHSRPMKAVLLLALLLAGSTGSTHAQRPPTPAAPTPSTPGLPADRGEACRAAYYKSALPSLQALLVLGSASLLGSDPTPATLYMVGLMVVNPKYSLSSDARVWADHLSKAQAALVAAVTNCGLPSLQPSNGRHLLLQNEESPTHSAYWEDVLARTGGVVAGLVVGKLASLGSDAAFKHVLPVLGRQLAQVVLPAVLRGAAAAVAVEAAEVVLPVLALYGTYELFAEGTGKIQELLRERAIKPLCLKNLGPERCEELLKEWKETEILGTVAADAITHSFKDGWSALFQAGKATASFAQLLDAGKKLGAAVAACKDVKELDDAVSEVLLEAISNAEQRKTPAAVLPVLSNTPPAVDALSPNALNQGITALKSLDAQLRQRPASPAKAVDKGKGARSNDTVNCTLSLMSPNWCFSNQDCNKAKLDAGASRVVWTQSCCAGCCVPTQGPSFLSRCKHPLGTASAATTGLQPVLTTKTYSLPSGKEVLCPGLRLDAAKLLSNPSSNAFPYSLLWTPKGQGGSTMEATWYCSPGLACVHRRGSYVVKGSMGPRGPVPGVDRRIDMVDCAPIHSSADGLFGSTSTSNG